LTGLLAAAFTLIAGSYWWFTATASPYTPVAVQDGQLLVAASVTAGAVILWACVPVWIISGASGRGRPLATAVVAASGFHIGAAVTAAAVLHATRAVDPGIGVAAAVFAVMPLLFALSGRAEVVAQQAIA